MKRWYYIMLLCSFILLLAACTRTAPSTTGQYVPQSRAFTIITVPLLTKEQQSLYPFLQKDFAAGGILSTKEVYSFQPDTLTVYKGDTLTITFVNPEDDVHSFILPVFHISQTLPAQKTVKTQFIANQVGIFQFICSIPTHTPYMAGTLVVLPDSDAPISAS